MSALRTKGSAFLNCFWDLVSDDQLKRNEAAVGILTYLHSLDDAQTTDERAKDIGYALKRLVRGLSSSRESARLGFASCLTEAVKLQSVTVIEVIDLIEDSTKITGSAKGVDERDLMFGRLFGFLALVRSGRLDEDFENGQKVFEALVELLPTKGWLREIVIEALLEHLEHSTPLLITSVMVPRYVLLVLSW